MVGQHHCGMNGGVFASVICLLLSGMNDVSGVFWSHTTHPGVQRCCASGCRAQLLGGKKVKIMDLFSSFFTGKNDHIRCKKYKKFKTLCEKAHCSCRHIMNIMYIITPLLFYYNKDI